MIGNRVHGRFRYGDGLMVVGKRKRRADYIRTNIQYKLMPWRRNMHYSRMEPAYSTQEHTEMRRDLIRHLWYDAMVNQNGPLRMYENFRTKFFYYRNK